MKIVKVKCNGPDKHINDIDLIKMLKGTTILRAAPEPSSSKQTSNYMDIPERLVLQCKTCAVGRVILEQNQIKEVLDR